MGLLGLLMLSSVSARAQSTSTVLVLGDSLSAAYGLSPEQGWVAAMRDRFKDNPFTFENASISGATTAAGLARLPSLMRQYNPKWVVLELGANDGLQGKPLAYIRRNLTALIQQAQAGGAEVMLVGVRLPPNLGHRYTEPFFAMYGELAQAYQLAYVPFLLEGVAGDKRLMQSDGLHPNAEGQQVMVQLMGAALEQFLTGRKGS